MMTNLSWSALLLAALGAVAWWGADDRPVCHETRPVFGPAACCERHKLGGTPAFALEAERRVRALAPPGRRARGAAE